MASLLAATALGEYTAVWSLYSNCDCSGPAKAEHTVPTCAPRTITAASVALECAPDGTKVKVHSFDAADCEPTTPSTTTTYPVKSCLSDTSILGEAKFSFECREKYTPRAQSIVGSQYADTTCGADAEGVIAATNYVSGCFASCKPPPPHGFPLANLLQVADPTGLTGNLCNGTNTSCVPPYAPEGTVQVGACQVLDKSTSVKYSWSP